VRTPTKSHAPTTNKNPVYLPTEKGGRKVKDWKMPDKIPTGRRKSREKRTSMRSVRDWRKTSSTTPP